METLKPKPSRRVSSILLELLGETGYKDYSVCNQCGLCISVCPSGFWTALSMLRILRLARLGSEERVYGLDELWMCTTCYTCQDSCPHGIATTDHLRILRNLAFSSGYALKNHIKVAYNLLKYGHAIPPKDEILKIREEIGLDPPPTTIKHDWALKQVRRLFEMTGFGKLLERYGVDHG